MARFGVPADISSDRGVQFTSGLWSAMAEVLCPKVHHTSAYHPQSNGLVERFHRHLKMSLRARLTGLARWMNCHGSCWVYAHLRKKNFTTSSAELKYGTPLTLPRDFIPAGRSLQDLPSSILLYLREKMRALAPVPTSRHGLAPGYVPSYLQTSKYVRIHSQRFTPYAASKAV